MSVTVEAHRGRLPKRLICAFRGHDWAPMEGQARVEVGGVWRWVNLDGLSPQLCGRCGAMTAARYNLPPGETVDLMAVRPIPSDTPLD